ncbi:hypothetical protein [Flavobacterium limnophilum]|uniref:hypothetical protein n=1 Tax=Flavobacterium limnophilum TaxID=3003262 RepID=UPI002482CC65|nr:hypothetical protein [Flavobacterium limnophilum]
MARIDKKSIISGSIANLVFRNVNGKQIVQSKPEKVNQTKATKLSASEFTQCSRWAKKLRISLIPFLVGLTDTYMYKRLTGQLYQALQTNTAKLKGQRTPCNADMSALAGFEFNTHSPFADYFLPNLAISLDSQRQLKVLIPEFEPKTEVVFAEQTYQAELVVYVLATNLEPDKAVVETHFILPIERQMDLVPATSWTSLPLPPDYFVLATAKLMYYNTNKFTARNYVNNKELNPACVVFAGGW